VYIRNYCDGEEIDLEILMDLHIFNFLKTKFGGGCMLSACMLCVLLAPEVLIGSYSYPVAKSLCHRLMMGDHEHTNSKNRCILNEPQSMIS
jgi:hypothetical protein